MKKIKLYIFIIVAIILILVGYLMATNRSNKQTMESSGETSFSISDANIKLDEEYINTDFAFSFRYPSGYKVSVTVDDAGDNILVVQDTKSDGFQIRIQKADEDVSAITRDMIKKDIPDIIMNDPVDVTVSGKGKGVMFQSDNPAFGGKSREVWFVYNRVIYQLSADIKYDDFVKAVLATWKF